MIQYTILQNLTRFIEILRYIEMILLAYTFALGYLRWINFKNLVNFFVWLTSPVKLAFMNNF